MSAVRIACVSHDMKQSNLSQPSVQAPTDRHTTLSCYTCQKSATGWVRRHNRLPSDLKALQHTRLVPLYTRHHLG
jgi:hypothetical protein